MSALRLAIIGGGHLGRIHAKLAQAHEQFQVVAVADLISIGSCVRSFVKDAPEPKSEKPPDSGRVSNIQRVGGLHHEYTRLAG